ncbi:hypothetical protein KUTeg_003277 [Tegillarca granosa]|uniref:G-protein coupled receptors family 1 profile domain-containing protein n=1 Tax=Tegillarca granosa TaxID=220873 RepID=A0ABQ9FLN5_TEGGR|nr:hypothetical protein KUTeg_003277 [Tegillarca granosa]
MGVHEVNFAINMTYGGEFLQDNGNGTELWEAFQLQYIFQGILLPIISLFGVIGNILTMVVLWRREMQSTTILFLRALVITDTGIIIVACVAISPFTIALFHPEMSLFKDVIYPNIYTAVNYTVMTIQLCNVWITVFVSVERYIAICHPFMATRICTKRKTWVSLIVISIIAVIYNIPRALATRAKTPCLENQEEGVCFVLVNTAFGESFMYVTVYMVWMYAIIIYIIPLTLLSVLNILIIKELMRMRERRAGTNIQEDSEANLSLVLVLIVVVFILCQTPGLFAQFDFLFNGIVMLKWLAVSNTLFVTNSSVNFLIYTAVGRKFRKTLLKVFRRIFGKSILSDVSRSSRMSIGGCEMSQLYKPVNEDTQIENLEKVRLKD